MRIPLALHLLIHLSLAILSGYLAGWYFKKIRLGLVFGFIGGFLIDLDHVLEYFFVYGLHFNLLYFSQGRQFLASDQIHLYFHAWEYAPLLIISAILLSKHKIIKTILFTLAFAGSVHLVTDTIINHVPLKFYSLTYRAERNFSAQKLMSPEAYIENQKLKQKLSL